MSSVSNSHSNSAEQKGKGGYVFAAATLLTQIADPGQAYDSNLRSRIFKLWKVVC